MGVIPPPRWAVVRERSPSCGKTADHGRQLYGEREPAVSRKTLERRVCALSTNYYKGRERGYHDSVPESMTGDR